MTLHIYWRRKKKKIIIVLLLGEKKTYNGICDMR